MAYGKFPMVFTNTWYVEDDETVVQYHAVKLNPTGDIEHAMAGEGPIGIVQERADEGEPVNVVMEGITPAWVNTDNGQILPGEYLTTDDNGFLTLAKEADTKFAIALEGAKDDCVISVFIVPAGRIGAGDEG
ncbi:MAG: DUF2190 family protein [Candidatus Thermoplasmatota archaeon]|nr:DUF2190 family protein [Candidatus Thermoplasmatota archaeon]